MLSFFRINAAYNIISLVILFLLLRIPAFVYDVPLMIAELKWMLVGEQIRAGNLLYVDILDDIGPFAGIFYAMVDFFVGRSEFAYKIIAMNLSLFQIIYLSITAHNRGLFTERNYVPGLILILLYNLSFDFYTISPALLANTFLVLAFGRIVSLIQKSNSNDEVFQIGFLIGIAFLFYSPSIVFYFFAIVSLNVYTGAKLRHQFLLTIGLLMPFLFVWLWYFIIGYPSHFINNYLLTVVQRRHFQLNEINGLISVYILPLIFALFGFFVAVGSNKYSNFQTRIQQTLLIWLLVAVISVGLMPYLAPHSFIIFLLPLAHFSIIFFLNRPKKWHTELFFFGVFVFVFYLNLQAFVPKLKNQSLTRLDNLKLKENPNFESIKRKKILVLGNDLSPYLNNQSATPYINWNLAKTELQQMNQYENVVKVVANLRLNAPEYIIDQENLMPVLISRIPAIGQRFKAEGQTGKNFMVYKRI